VATWRPVVEPYVPAGQDEHVAEPANEYVPKPHGPEHWSSAPVPYRPAAHGEHVVEPAAAHFPAGQLAQTLVSVMTDDDAPMTAYFRGGQITRPVHLEDVRPVVEPYVPAGH